MTNTLLINKILRHTYTYSISNNRQDVSCILQNANYFLSKVRLQIIEASLHLKYLQKQVVHITTKFLKKQLGGFFIMAHLWEISLKSSEA